MSATLQKPGKNETAIRQGLDQARGRVRLLDLVSGILGLAALLLGFVCLMVLLDSLLHLSLATRQFALLLFLAGAGFYAWAFVIRPFRMEVNPRFAARQLERTIAHDRGNLVAWLDLQGEAVPGIFKAGLGSRAAKDMGDADAEAALPASRAWTMGACASGMICGFVLLFILFGPKPFASLLGRAFGLPGGIAKRTRISIVQPGDATVTLGKPVVIVARIEGRVPGADDRDAPTLLLRTDEDSPTRTLPLTQEGGEWQATLSPSDLGSGLLYKATAGDDETEEYALKTRPAPLLSHHLAVYRYRAYLQRGDATRTARRIDDVRGTQVTITARANREVASSKLEIENGASIAGEREGDRIAWKTTLDKPGRYRLGYATPEGDSFLEAEWHEIAVRDDGVPLVSLTLPGQDIKAAANAVIELEGEAADDVGIAGLTLHLSVDGMMQQRPYLPGKLGKTSTPRRVDYREVLPLAPLKLNPGAKVEYWLEARDACDAPRPNTSRTKSYFIEIEGTKDAATQKKEEEAAAKKKEEHDKKQEEKLKEDAAAKAKQKEKEDKQAKEDAKENDPSRAGSRERPEPSNQDKKDNDTKDKADNLKDALDNKKNERGKGKDSPPEDKPGEKKDGDKPGEGKGGEGKDAGEKKEAGKDGEGKSEGKDGKEKPGEKKDGGAKGESKGGDKGESKGGEGKPPGDAKGDAKPGDAKGEGKPAGDSKGGEGKPSPGKPSDKGEGKPGGPAPGKGKPGEKGAGEGKGSPSGPGKGEPKGMGDPAGATPEDARELGEQAKRGGAEGAAAKKALEDIRDGADDPAARQAAADALAGEKGEGKGEGDGPPDASAKGGDPGMGEAKGGGTEAGKGRAGGGEPGEGKGESRGGGASGDTPPPPAKKVKPRTPRASVLQLEEFKKRVDANVLKDARMSKEQFEKFLRDYEDLAKRQAKAGDPDDEKLGGPSTLPGSVGGAGPDKDKPDTARGTGTPKPPAEYRDSYSEFIRRRNMK